MDQFSASGGRLIDLWEAAMPATANGIFFIEMARYAALYFRSITSRLQSPELLDLRRQQFAVRKECQAGIAEVLDAEATYQV